MDFLKELFTQPLSFEDFVKAVTEKGYKLADLSKGDYVAKGKLDEANGKIKTLTDDIGKLITNRALRFVTLASSATGSARDLTRSRGFGGHVKLKRPSNLFPLLSLLCYLLF